MTLAKSRKEFKPQAKDEARKISNKQALAKQYDRAAQIKWKQDVGDGASRFD